MDILYRAPPNALMYTRTTQFSIFKNICDSINGLLGDGNFKVTEKGIVLQHMDPRRNCIVKLVLDKFEHHYCKREFYMGFSISGLYDEIRYITGEMIVLFIEEPPEGSNQGVDKLKVFVYDEEEVNEITIPLYKNMVEDYEFDNFEKASRVVSLPNNRFQRLIKKVSTNATKQNVTDPVTGEVTKAKICFTRCQDDLLIFGSTHKNGRNNQSVIRPHPRKTAVRWCAINPNHGDDNFTNYYFTRYLEKFCKHQLDEKVILYMRKDFIIVLRYELGDLGYICFMLAPIPPETIEMHPTTDTPQEVVHLKKEFDVPDRRKRPRMKQAATAKRPRLAKKKAAALQQDDDDGDDDGFGFADVQEQTHDDETPLPYDEGDSSRPFADELNY